MNIGSGNEEESGGGDAAVPTYSFERVNAMLWHLPITAAAADYAHHTNDDAEGITNNNSNLPPYTMTRGSTHAHGHTTPTTTTSSNSEYEQARRRHVFQRAWDAVLAQLSPAAEEQGSVLNTYFYTWVGPYIRLASREALEEDKFPPPRRAHRARLCGAKLSEYFRTQEMQLRRHRWQHCIETAVPLHPSYINNTTNSDSSNASRASQAVAHSGIGRRGAAVLFPAVTAATARDETGTVSEKKNEGKEAAVTGTAMRKEGTSSNTTTVAMPTHREREEMEHHTDDNTEAAKKKTTVMKEGDDTGHNNNNNTHDYPVVGAVNRNDEESTKGRAAHTYHPDSHYSTSQHVSSSSTSNSNNSRVTRAHVLRPNKRSAVCFRNEPTVRGRLRWIGYLSGSKDPHRLYAGVEWESAERLPRYRMQRITTSTIQRRGRGRNEEDDAVVVIGSENDNNNAFSPAPHHLHHTTTTTTISEDEVRRVSELTGAHDGMVHGERLFYQAMPSSSHVLTQAHTNSSNAHTTTTSNEWDSMTDVPRCTCERVEDIVLLNVDAITSTAAKAPSPPSLARALLHTFTADFLSTLAPACIGTAAQIVTPLLLQRYVAFMEMTRTPHSTRDGVTLLLVLALVKLLQPLFNNKTMQRGERVSALVGSATLSLVFEKCMTIAPDAMAHPTVSAGRILAIASSDVDNLRAFPTNLYVILTASAELIVYTALLFTFVGWSALGSIVVLVCTVPLQALVARWQDALTTRLSTFTDQRLRSTNELLSGIRIVKSMGWEAKFLASIERTARRNELRYRRLLQLSDVIVSGFLLDMLPSLMILALLLVHTLRGKPVGPQVIFPLISIMSSFYYPLEMLPQVVTMFVKFRVSARRVTRFLECEDQHTTLRDIAAFFDRPDAEDILQRVCANNNNDKDDEGEKDNVNIGQTRHDEDTTQPPPSQNGELSTVKETPQHNNSSSSSKAEGEREEGTTTTTAAMTAKENVAVLFDRATLLATVPVPLPHCARNPTMSERMERYNGSSSGPMSWLRRVGHTTLYRLRRLTALFGSRQARVPVELQCHIVDTPTTTTSNDGGVGHVSGSNNNEEEMMATVEMKVQRTVRPIIVTGDKANEQTPPLGQNPTHITNTTTTAVAVVPDAAAAQTTSNNNNNEEDEDDSAGPMGKRYALVPRPLLTHITLCIPRHRLTVVVGPTGSGKSSLLASLIGGLRVQQQQEQEDNSEEKKRGSGAVWVPAGAIAYVPQVAWIVQDTIRANIMFYEGNSSVDEGEVEEMSEVEEDNGNGPRHVAQPQSNTHFTNPTTTTTMRHTSSTPRDTVHYVKQDSKGGKGHVHGVQETNYNTGTTTVVEVRSPLCRAHRATGYNNSNRPDIARDNNHEEDDAVNSNEEEDDYSERRARRRALADARLARAVRCCQLESDLKGFDRGLDTEIGEQGVNLSGGQKARVGLARAVYANKALYLLDDPLSALDAHVGRKVLHEVVLKELRPTTRILATHQLHALPHADQVVVLHEGRVRFRGSYRDYVNSPWRHILESEKATSHDNVGSSGNVAQGHHAKHNKTTTNSNAVVAEAPVVTWRSRPVEAPASLSTTATTTAAPMTSRVPQHPHTTPANQPEDNHHTTTSDEDDDEDEDEDEDVSTTTASAAMPSEMNYSPTLSHLARVSSGVVAYSAFTTAAVNKAAGVETSAATPPPQPHTTTTAHSGSNRTEEGHHGDALVSQRNEQQQQLQEDRRVGLTQGDHELLATTTTSARVSPHPNTSPPLHTRNTDTAALPPSAGPNTTTTGAPVTGQEGKLIVDEEKEVGRVPFSVYLRYCKAGGGYVAALCALACFALVEGCGALGHIWLSLWSVAFFHRLSDGQYLMGYVVCCVMTLIMAVTCTLVWYRFARHAGRSLHTQLLYAITSSTVTFFDRTPLGRIVNRFSHDIYMLDNELPMVGRILLQVMCYFIFSMLVSAYSTPPAMVVMLIAGIGFFFILRFYATVIREVRRRGSIAQSPMFSLLTAVLNGRQTIAAYGKLHVMFAEALRRLDRMYSCYYFERAVNQWLAIRLEYMGCVIMLAVAGFGVIEKLRAAEPTLPSARVGLISLSLTVCLDLFWILPVLVEFAAMVEASMNSAQRVLHYVDHGDREELYLQPIQPHKGKHKRHRRRRHRKNDSSDPHAMREGDNNDEYQVQAGQRNEEEEEGMAAPQRDEDGAVVVVDATQSRHRGTITMNSVSSPHTVTVSQAGSLEFDHVSMRYRPGLPLVLRDVSFAIAPRQKVGVVGRTGSGKSTLLLTFLRLVNISAGTIRVCGRDAADYRLPALRRLFAMIPQDPVLFEGTVRSNIDPFAEASDDAVRRALELVGITTTPSSSSGNMNSSDNHHLYTQPSVPELPTTASNSGIHVGSASEAAMLINPHTNNVSSATSSNGANALHGSTPAITISTPVQEGGSNFSVGQRQLLCLARALLKRDSAFLLMDEATANVDPLLDRQIQRVVREQFVNYTVITIAHRLHTVAGYDTVLVMQKGQLVEQGSPRELVLRPHSLFREMVIQAAMSPSSAAEYGNNETAGVSGTQGMGEEVEGGMGLGSQFADFVQRRAEQAVEEFLQQCVSQA